jgi:predicted metal-dependent hydrolase
MSTTHAEIVRRRVKLDYESADSGNWHRTSREFQNRLNAISFLFPAGELFFVNSVRNYVKRIKDPVLLDEAERFIYQEAMHSKEHARSNGELQKHHPYGAEMQRIGDALLNFSRWLWPPASQLQISCALEHYTAMLADALLRKQDNMIRYCDPAFSSLWLWHAVEEIEHKAVCFDVYQHFYGKGVLTYLHRVIMMVLVSICLVGGVAIGFQVIRWKQWQARRKAGVPAALKVAAAEAPKLSATWRLIEPKLFFEYFRYSYHPWDHDNRDLIAEWKAKYAGFGLTPEAAGQVA